jgi:hypothetical protein
MRSNAGMANRQGDRDLREAQLKLWLGLAWLGKQVRSQVQALLDVSNVELCKFQLSKNKQE